MAHGNATVSFERIASGSGIGLANGPVTATFHLPPGPRESLPSPSTTVPFFHDPDHIDRPGLRDEISTKLSLPGARVAILTVDYVRRVGRQLSQTWVLWLPAGTATRFEQSVRDIADKTKIHGRHDVKANIFELFRNWLWNSKQAKWTLVLDNLDDAGFLLAPPVLAEEGRTRRLIDYIPTGEHGSVLITTRSKRAARRLVPSSQILEVSPMENKYARALLEKKLGVDKDESHERLAEALDFLPNLHHIEPSWKKRRRAVDEQVSEQSQEPRHKRIKVESEKGQEQDSNCEKDGAEEQDSIQYWARTDVWPKDFGQMSGPKSDESNKRSRSSTRSYSSRARGWKRSACPHGCVWGRAAMLRYNVRRFDHQGLGDSRE